MKPGRASAALDLANTDGHEPWRITPANFGRRKYPSGAPRPDASKAQILMAGLLARGSLPLAPSRFDQWLRRGLVAYSCGGSSGIGIAPSPASLFTSHEREDHRARTVSASWCGVNTPPIVRFVLT